MYLNIPDRVHLSFEKSLEADCMYWEMLKRRGQKGGQKPRLEIYTICTIGNCMGALFLQKDGFTRWTIFVKKMEMFSSYGK